MATRAPTAELWICGKKVRIAAPSIWLLLIAVFPRGAGEAPLTMLTDTFTAQAFFVDFISDPTRALRWGSLRQDSGDPFAFVKSAKQAWKEVEGKQGVSREDGVVAKGKRIIFSDGLDIDTAIALQKGCDDLGIGGKLLSASQG
jgi:nicotinate phosphoribosyltransferase